MTLKVILGSLSKTYSETSNSCVRLHLETTPNRLTHISVSFRLFCPAYVWWNYSVVIGEIMKGIKSHSLFHYTNMILSKGQLVSLHILEPCWSSALGAVHDCGAEIVLTGASPLPTAIFPVVHQRARLTLVHENWCSMLDLMFWRHPASSSSPRRARIHTQIFNTLVISTTFIFLLFQSSGKKQTHEVTERGINV